MSTLRTTTIAKADGSASVPVNTVINGSAKVWCYSSSGGSLNTGFNVSSITDTGTGLATVNFTEALVDTNYCVVALVVDTASTGGTRTITTASSPKSVSSVGTVASAGGTLTEYPFCLAVFR